MRVEGRLQYLFIPLIAGLSVALSLLIIPGFANPVEGSPSVIISEVAWGGAQAGVWLEWIELHNRTLTDVDLSEWYLSDSEDISITLSGNIGPDGYYLLERFDDAVADIRADQLFVGTLDDSGESLILLDQDKNVIDSANFDGGSWPGGKGSPDFQSMERVAPDSPDEDANWTSNNGLIRNGIDSDGNPINGTPAKANSSWIQASGKPDLYVFKSSPITVTSGQFFTYSITFGNIGTELATNTFVSDTLPENAIYIGDNAQFPLEQPETNLLVWHVGELITGTLSKIELMVTTEHGFSGTLINHVQISSDVADFDKSNNSDVAVVDIIGSFDSGILIDAIYFDTRTNNEPDEAIRLINIGPSNQDISSWQVSDLLSAIILPENTSIAQKESVWLTNEAEPFRRQFGFAPDFALIPGNTGAIQLDGSWPRLSNSGDAVFVHDAEGGLIDTLVYINDNTVVTGWYGPPVHPYTVAGIFGQPGQILYRKRSQILGLPQVDTDSASDWAQSLDDPINGRRVLYPGWDLDHFFFPMIMTETAEVIIGTTPDNGFGLLTEEIATAKSSINIEMHTLTHPELASALVRAAEQGVTVTILLEGNPVGGVEPTEIESCRLIEEAGGACWYMVASDENNSPRYRYLHAKTMIIDDQRAVISTENMSPDSFPDLNGATQAQGHRGLVLITDAPSVVERLNDIWMMDFDPLNHDDINKTASISTPNDFFSHHKPELFQSSEVISYTVRYPNPVTFTGIYRIELIQAPENSIRTDDGILRLIEETQDGDTILSQQLTERNHWGSASGTPLSDPNPRLEAFIAAARRGATVRLLLDSYYDPPDGDSNNEETCHRVNQIAAHEKLDLACAQNNPTGLGIHNKMILVSLNGDEYIFIGSINGSELSHKGNREVALLLASDEIYMYLSKMFYLDWPWQQYLPVIQQDYNPPVNYVLISEVLYDPSGREDAEFVELANPTPLQIQLEGYGLGDATNRSDFEDLRRFPEGTIIPAGGTIVVAGTAAAFKAKFGYDPDFEFVDSLPLIPNMIDDLSWGDPAAVMRLGNSGDEVILRSPADVIVDGIAYGDGNLPDVVACPLLIAPDYSLERYPYWQDTDDCLKDIREWPFPNPGYLP